MSIVTAPLPLSDDHPVELLNRPITPPLQTAEIDLEEIYEIERTVSLLREGSFKTVALQFPDDLLHDSAKVSRRLQDSLDGVKTYILADTSYGSCCVDEIAAEHINADVVVHYGRACLSP
jgi:diphthamide biosynthesis protein 2